MPDPDAVRRNKPTIPTTNLPAGGFKEPTPDLPDGYSLNEAGWAWWEWAWHTPQAAAWDDGAIYTVARRAQLETDLSALAGDVGDDAVTIAQMLDIPEDDRVRELATLFHYVKRAASNEVQIMKEIRELDNKLGLNPHALAALRWKVVGDDEAPQQKAPTPAKSRKEQRARLSVAS